MKKIGVAVLGLFVGLVVGFVLHEVIAIALFAATDDVPREHPLSAMIRLITPVCGVLGVGAALVVERRRERNANRARHDPRSGRCSGAAGSCDSLSHGQMCVPSHSG